MTEHQQESLWGTILAVIGFLIIAGIAVWGLAHILVLAKNTFSPWFTGNAQSIVVSAPANATSGETFQLSWKHTPTTSGSYGFLYSCVSGVRFETPNASGSTTKIPCGTSFAASTSPLTLIPYLNSGSKILTPVTILFKPGTGSQALGSLASNALAEGSAVITVTKATQATTVTPTTPTKKPTSVSTPKKTTVATHSPSPADLSVSILDIGVIDPQSGAFVARAPFGPQDVVAVRFDIKNSGGSASGSYRFSVELPTDTAYIYHSPLQSSLSGGSHVVNTLRFDHVTNGTVLVNVLPNGRDAQVSNNTAVRSL